MCWPAALWCAAQEPVDRILAVVDDDPILASQVEQIVGLGLAVPQEGESDLQFRRRILDFVIEQKLQFHEVDRFGFAEVPLDEVDRQVELFQQRFDDKGAFARRLAELDLNEQGLRQLFARQVMVTIYVEERLGARIFVGLEEIQRYYDDVLRPQLVAAGSPVPPMSEVREEIRQVLREQLLNEEIERWTQDLRLEADVIDYFERGHEELPPVVYSSDG